MSYSISCADAGMICPGQFTTETKDELMEHVELHASRAHPDLKLDEETRARIDRLVKTS